VRTYAAVASLVPALICFAYVEQPLRRMRAAPARRLALIAVAVVALPFIVDGAMASTVTGVWTPGYKPTDMRVAHRGAIGEAAFYRYLASHYPTCSDRLLRRYALEFERIRRCAQSKHGSAVDVAVIGDSHAEHLFVGLADALPHRNVLYDIVDDAPTMRSEGFARIVDDVAARRSVDTVVLSAYWYIRAVTRRGDLVPTLRALRAPGRQVFVTDDVPAFPFDAFTCKYRKAVFVGAVCHDSLADLRRAYTTYDAALRSAVASVPGTHLIHTYDQFCSGATCAMTHDGRLLYRDWNHLNVAGSRFVADRMLLDPRFARATAGPRPRPR
jgi:hypothetical protein